MRKNFFSMAVLLSAMLFTACNDSDNGSTSYSVPVSNGVYVLCSGNVWGGINGDLTYIDYATGNSANGQFKARNGRELGGTPNDIFVYGDKMYIAVTDENTLEVVDAKTLASIKQIKLTDVMGESGKSPRHLTAADGVVYVSTYGGCSNTFDPDTWAVSTEGNGYVAAIDTLTFSLKDTYTVGSYPEGIDVVGNTLIVANSDYSAQTKACVSVINLQTKERRDIKDSKITNPVDVAVAGSDIYVMDQGNYADVKGGMRKIDNSNNVTTLFDCTNATFIGSNIFAADCPYGANVKNFIVYDIETRTKREIASGVDKFFYPSVVTVDPVTGNIFVASYNEKADTPDAPDYSANGYVVEYDFNGNKLQEYPCGVGPVAVVFRIAYKNVVY